MLFPLVSGEKEANRKKLSRFLKSLLFVGRSRQGVGGRIAGSRSATG